MEGHNVNEFYSKEESEQYYSADLAVLNSGIGNLNIEEKWESKNGIRYFNTSKIPFLNTEGQIVGIIGISMDISERILHEKEMTRLTSELRELSHHLQFIREEERSSIAKEIHDEFAQNLVALSMNAAFLKSSLKGKNKELIKLVDEQLHIADEVIKTSRTLFNTLHPSMLDELGLESAIRWYVKNHSKDSGIHIEIAINLQEEYIPKAINLLFFRVFQECFINLQQHSKATKGKVEIYKVDTNLTMVFSDNGIGFDVDAVNSSQSHGLLGIREMAYRLKGSFLIHSDSTGTTLELRIPLR